MLARKLTYSCLFLFALGSLTCREHIADVPVAHRLPKTFLWLFPDSTVRTGVSRTHLYWWGESPGGVVRGYLFGFAIVTQNVTTLPQPDTIHYTWVTGNDTTILFPLDTLFRKFVVVVRAVDNVFAGLPERSSVRMKPFPFWDVNGNGAFDGNDVRLGALEGATDPAGAVLTFPIRNTPPTIAFLPNPSDPQTAQRLPDVSFPAMTIAFKGADDDGDNTLASYRIALNDTGSTGQWLTVSLRDTMVTLVVPRARSDAAGSTVTADVYSGTFLGRRLIGQLTNLRLNGENVFYVEARDVAGEYSNPIRLPGGTDHWYVKKPVGRLLLVSDYARADAPQALATYVSSLASVGGGFTRVDTLDIGLGLSGSEKENGKLGSFVPQFVDPALAHTFLMYDYVLWYSDLVPALGVAQRSVFFYLQNGGRVIFSTMFLNTSDPRGALRDFAPIDSVSSVELTGLYPLPAAGDNRIPPDYVLIPDSTNPARIFPTLAFNSLPPGNSHSVFMRPIYRRSDARYLYRLQPDTRVPQRYIGSPTIAVVDGQNTIIFVGLPLHLLNNTTLGTGLTAFLEKAIGQFSVTQRVNRRRF